MAFLGDDGRLDDVTEEDVERTERGARKMLEEGWYRAALVEDEVQQKSWGIGLKMKFQILTGECEGQPIYDYLCVRHGTSEKAEQIARAKLKAFAIAAGSKNPDDVSDTGPLHDKPVMIEIYREKDDTDYAEEDGKKARVGAFKSVARFREENADSPMPGVKRKAQAAAPPPEPERAPSPPPDDDEIPF